MPDGKYINITDEDAEMLERWQHCTCDECPCPFWEDALEILCCAVVVTPNVIIKPSKVVVL